MSRGFRQIGALIAISSVTAIPAGELLEPPDLSEYLRWGPIRVRPGLRVSDLGYDDNVFFDSTDPVSDYRLTVSPRLDGLLMLGSRAFLTFSEQLEYTAYVENSEQNYWNQRGKARLTVPLKRIAVFTDLRADGVQERPVDQTDDRVERDDEGYGVGLLVQAGWRAGIELGWNTLRRRHFDPSALNPQALPDSLDRTETGFKLSSTFRLVGRTRLTLEAQRRELDFRTERNSSSWEIQPGVDFGVGGRVTGKFRLGWARISTDGPDRPNLSEAVGHAELAYRSSSRLTFKLTGERRPGFAISRDYYVLGSYGLRGIYFFNRGIGVETGGSAGRLTFPGSAAVTPRIDRIRRYDVGVRLRLSENALGRRVEYSLKLGRYRRDSTNSNLDQSQNTVSINAELGF